MPSAAISAGEEGAAGGPSPPAQQVSAGPSLRLFVSCCSSHLLSLAQTESMLLLPVYMYIYICYL